MVAAADRAAATCQRWATTKLQGKRTEGVAGAIGKLPDGLRPPPRLRRGDTPASTDAPPWLLPQKELLCATRMTEDTLPLAAYFQACQDMLY